ncbi:MAG: hypothetical protein KAQ63_01330 [Candidatus Moranbacteria bacterium]|nr:hypothetical protein [Candidatus Moranbacteria bacterium]
MTSQKERKRKNPVHLKRVIRNAEKEIGVLTERLESGKIPVAKVGIVENRLCTLMNRTIPNAKESLAVRLLV